MEDYENIINDSELDKLKKYLLICIAVCSFLFVILMFVLEKIDMRGCDGLFGGLTGDCTSSNYFTWGLISIPFALFCLFGALAKNVVLSVVGTVLFFSYNVFMFFVTGYDRMRNLSIVCMIFLGVLFLVEMYIWSKE